MALSDNVRRVVTTVDADDKAVVLFDGPTPHKKVRPQSGTVSRLLWVTDETPAVLSGAKGPALIPVLGGTGRLQLVYGILLSVGLFLSA